MTQKHKARLFPLTFLIALSAGCAQQAQQPTDAERIATNYPDAGQMAVASSEPDHDSRVVATGLDQPTHDVEPDIYRDRDTALIPVLREGRYALLATHATLQERHLLEQIVNVSIPASINPTVEDGLRYTLQHTGYRLGPPQGDPQRLLYSRPLPAAHFRLGPMPLREALQVLAGSAFEVQADPFARTVYFQVRDQRLVEE